MNYGQIAIFDNDSDYANSLADYFRLKGCIASEIIVFTKIDIFKDYAKRHSFDILLINHMFISDIDGDLESLPQNLFILCEHKILKTEDNGTYIFKYISAEDILRLVMTSYKPDSNGVTISFCDNRKCNIIGIYSPIGRCGKTSFALALALHFSLVNSCVFLSFDNFSTLGTLISGEDESIKTIDDLLYYFTGSPTLLDSKLLSVVKHIQQLDIIPPSLQCCSLGDINISERVQFIKGLADTGKYDYIFIDIGNINPVNPILELCKIIYVPTPCDDTYSEKKINLFMSSTNNLTSENRRLIKQISLPVIHSSNRGSEYIYALTSGDMKILVTSLASDF